jgi:hypothetical protein
MSVPNFVFVHAAFVFQCLSCGPENFVHAVPHEFSEDEKDEWSKDLGDSMEADSWVTHPEQVTCSKCQHTFIAIGPDGYWVSASGFLKPISSFLDCCESREGSTGMNANAIGTSYLFQWPQKLHLTLSLAEPYTPFS